MYSCIMIPACSAMTFQRGAVECGLFLAESAKKTAIPLKIKTLYPTNINNILPREFQVDGVFDNLSGRFDASSDHGLRQDAVFVVAFEKTFIKEWVLPTHGRSNCYWRLPLHSTLSYLRQQSVSSKVLYYVQFKRSMFTIGRLIIQSS